MPKMRKFKYQKLRSAVVKKASKKVKPIKTKTKAAPRAKRGKGQQR